MAVMKRPKELRKSSSLQTHSHVSMRLRHAPQLRVVSLPGFPVIHLMKALNPLPYLLIHYHLHLEGCELLSRLIGSGHPQADPYHLHSAGRHFLLQAPPHLRRSPLGIVPHHQRTSQHLHPNQTRFPVLDCICVVTVGCWQVQRIPDPADRLFSERAQPLNILRLVQSSAHRRHPFRSRASVGHLFHVLRISCGRVSHDRLLLSSSKPLPEVFESLPALLPCIGNLFVHPIHPFWRLRALLVDLASVILLHLICPIHRQRSVLV
mmetsp:Transcript_71266/g.148754  ORF Transcript_71266/g.148754 Transcript_71266/m.148754 type:complete len:264 (+) Transcript_71266:558-1349(+)